MSSLLFIKIKKNNTWHPNRYLSLEYYFFKRLLFRTETFNKSESCNNSSPFFFVIIMINKKTYKKLIFKTRITSWMSDGYLSFLGALDRMPGVSSFICTSIWVFFRMLMVEINTKSKVYYLLKHEYQ